MDCPNEPLLAEASRNGGGHAVTRGMAQARAALLNAFSKLALSRRYSDFGVGHIVSDAGVGRSTFYYHFRQKDDLLLANLAPFLSAVAASIAAGAADPALLAWLHHVWEYREKGRRMFTGETGRKVARALEQALCDALRRAEPRQAEVRLRAAQASGAAMSLLDAWLRGAGSASPEVLAAMLVRGA